MFHINISVSSQRFVQNFSYDAESIVLRFAYASKSVQEQYVYNKATKTIFEILLSTQCNFCPCKRKKKTCNDERHFYVRKSKEKIYNSKDRVNISLFTVTNVKFKTILLASKGSSSFQASNLAL